jgi:hypothetical protein
MPAFAGMKFEYRNPKFETNSKLKCPNVQNRKAAGVKFLSFEFGTFSIVSDFGLRISDFQIPCKSLTNFSLGV